MDGLPPPDPTTGLQIGWQPTEVVQDSHTDSDPAVRWNHAELGTTGTLANPGAGLIATDLGNPNTLYQTNLSQDSSGTNSPLGLAAAVNGIAESYFASFHFNRTTGIVGMNNPGATLIAEIIDENNMPIQVTSDSDAAGATGTLRAAINTANSQPGVNTIEIANNLTGTSGQAIDLQADLPVITSDLDIAGTVFIVSNGHMAFQNSSQMSRRLISSLLPESPDVCTDVHDLQQRPGICEHFRAGLRQSNAFNPCSDGQDPHHECRHSPVPGWPSCRTAFY